MMTQLEQFTVMSNDLKYSRVEKIGRVSLEQFRTSYRLRWTLNGKTYQLTIGLISKECLAVAKAKASQIDADILTGQFDPSLNKYDSRKVIQISQQTQQLADSTAIEKKPNLKDIWEHYKSLSGNSVQLTTQKSHWKALDTKLDKIEDQSLLEFSNASKLVLYWLDKFSPSTVDRLFTDINSAFNLANEIGFISEPKNPYAALKKRGLIDSNQDNNNRTRECFTDSEIKIIWDAFKTNRYNPDKSAYKHDYYLPFVQFCSLTGCRPGEAIALTWDDIKYKTDRTWINISKSYSDGILKCTKTGETRLFPVNDQLSETINGFPKIDNEFNLIFPSIKDRGYIDQHNFNTRIWKPVVSRLVVDDLVSKYLPSYNLRHSFITRMILLQMDLAQLARISGNSTEVIISSYYSSNNETVIPAMTW